MGIPKKYVGHYPLLANWLVSIGHLVYPYEMTCDPVIVKDKKPSFTMKLRGGNYTHYETHHLYGLVDVVSRFQDKMWAWEYKSENDNILRALKQTENYARSFDYVSVVVENLSATERHIRSKGLYVKTILKNWGIGVIWNDEGKFKIVDEPKMQEPKEPFNEYIRLKFDRYCRILYGKPYLKAQKTKIADFFNL
ncbi:unnamed protein product [marine sediment metagenome]|uniref:Uncharacterized protein n=1 Tax=marine sediment metagenome TaxID=412755 RepID=X1PZ19_9ZZZZ